MPTALPYKIRLTVNKAYPTKKNNITNSWSVCFLDFPPLTWNLY